MKKMKNMKKSTMVSVVIMLAFAILLTSATAVINQTRSSAVEDDAAPKVAKTTKATKVKKPEQVEGVEEGERVLQMGWIQECQLYENQF